MSKSILKNVSLIRSLKDGRESWRLLGPDGRPVHAYEIFANSLMRLPYHTRRHYSRWVAEFLNYLFEASICPQITESGNVSREMLGDIIGAYDEYLVFGEDAGSEIARNISKTLPSPRISGFSSATKHAAIRYLLRLNERVRAQMLELTEVGVCHFVDPQKLFVELNERRVIPAFQRQALFANSMMAGVIAGGPKFIECISLRTAMPEITYDHERAFPFDLVFETLGYCRTYRDKALYALCAASGCRISEALQLLWEDIDMVAQSVRLVDPTARKNCASYLSLKPIERDKLVWKGRTTVATLLIDPFATWFFEALAGYLRYEYVPHGRHSFVFQYDEGAFQGAPYFLASASSRNGVLRRAVKLAGVERIQGPHSFRHMYGTYLLNFFPRPNGSYGLPLGTVQKLMGHKHAKDTAKYARIDMDRLDAELRYANLQLFSHGDAVSLNEFKRKILLARLAEVEAQLNQEKGAT
ncbi:tyrosine-type recombinase/integrase [Massilia eburnea]|uniref:tyrosine-type recombinase/integrase n=1 Tax=Massilia eburnea TaxID=1776165 RepID=UPI003D6C0FFC